jgi:hypothetical protein
MTIGIGFNASTNVEIINPRNQVIDTVTGVTNYSKYIHWGSNAPPFPKNLGIYWFVVHNPQTNAVDVTFSLSSGGILMWLGGDDAINQTLSDQYSLPYINTCNASGYPTNTFQSDEDVYVKGAGYQASTQMTIYVISDGEDAATGNAKAVAHTTTDANGTLVLSLLWSHPLSAGSYDVWVDANNNGVFDASDILSDAIIGVAAFFIIPESPIVVLLFTMLAAALVLKRKTRARKNKEVDA